MDSRTARRHVAATTTWPTPCPACGRELHVTDPWVAIHRIPVSARPELRSDPGNLTARCARCDTDRGDA